MLPGADPGPGLHFPAHRGFFLFSAPGHIFFPASQSFSSRKFSSVPADPSAREGLPPPFPLQGTTWQLPLPSLQHAFEKSNDSALEPGTSRTPETNNFSAHAQLQPFSSLSPCPRSWGAKRPRLVGLSCTSSASLRGLESLAGALPTAEPPISPVLKSGGSTLRCFMSPRRAPSSHPGSPGDSQESRKKDGPRQRLEAAGKIYIVISAGGQSWELPLRPRSHHPAHSCSWPFGNQTLLEENKKDLIGFTLFFQWEVYTIKQDKPAGGHGEHFISSLIYL